jgi:stage V sporulation protein B
VAAFGILGISTLLVRREPRPMGAFSTAELLRFGAWLAVLTLLANLLLTADLWIVKRLADPAVANERAGVYRAALTLSQLLYQMLIPLALVLFPTLARLAASGDPGTSRGVVRGALRYLSVTVLPGAALLAASGGDLLRLLYGRAYEGGGPWLVFLAPAYAGWTAAYLLAVALASAGHVRSGAGVLALGLAAQVVAGVLLHPALGPRGVAIGDVIGSALAVGAGLALAVRRFGDIVAWGSLAHGAALALVLLAIVKLWPTPLAWLPVKLAACVAAGVAFLFARGELAPPARAMGAR